MKPSHIIVGALVVMLLFSTLQDSVGGSAGYWLPTPQGEAPTSNHHDYRIDHGVDSHTHDFNGGDNGHHEG